MDAFIGSLLERLLTTSVHTALLTIVVWVICHWMPRLSPSTQGWLWWMVGLQALIGLVASPIALPWLPPQVPVVLPMTMPVTSWNLGVADGGQAMSSGARDALPLWQPTIVILWMVGILVMVGATLRDWRRGRQLLRTSLPCTDTLVLQNLAHATEVSGLHTSPRVHISNYVDSPLLIGHFRPVLLLPARTLLSGRELQMVFAHELAHLCRGDLWWGCIPSLARNLFFFHPLAHVAAREYSIAREAACDAAAVGSDQGSRQEYGRLLLQLGASPETSTGIAVASPTYRALKKRLTMLQNVVFLPRFGSVAVLAVIAAAGVLPLRLVAAAATPEAAGTSVELRGAAQPPTRIEQANAPRSTPTTGIPPDRLPRAAEQPPVAEGSKSQPPGMQVSESHAQGSGQAAGTVLDGAQRVQEAESRLAQLRLRYSDKHPEIIAMRQNLDGLRRQPALATELERQNAEIQSRLEDLQTQATEQYSRLRALRAKWTGVPQADQPEGGRSEQRADVMATLDQVKAELDRADSRIKEAESHIGSATEIYRIRTGDTLTIYVWQHPELGATVQVLPDGRFLSPLVENMVAAGKSPLQLSRDMEGALKQYIRSPRVTVIVNVPAPR